MVILQKIYFWIYLVYKYLGMNMFLFLKAGAFSYLPTLKTRKQTQDKYNQQVSEEPRLKWSLQFNLFLGLFFSEPVEEKTKGVNQ